MQGAKHVGRGSFLEDMVNSSNSRKLPQLTTLCPHGVSDHIGVNESSDPSVVFLLQGSILMNVVFIFVLLKIMELDKGDNRIKSLWGGKYF